MGEVTTAEDVLKKISAEHLECSICCSRYNHPKILDCLHSFCAPCLENYRRVQHPSSVKLPCPLCRRDTPLPKEGVLLGLKGNFNLTALVEEFTNQESLVRRQQSQIVCEVCEDEEANSRCIECKDYLCGECQKAHRRAVKTKKHEIATLEDLRSGKACFKSKMRDEIPKCQNHPTQEVVFFCTTCQVLICHVCTALDHSNTTHVYVYIEKAERLFRETAKILLSKATDSTAEFRSAKKVIDHAMQTLDGVIAAASADISKRADEDVARVRQQEDILKKKVSEIGIERLKLLETSHDTYCESLKWAEHTLEKATSVLEQSSRFEVLELKQQLVKNLTDVSEQQVPGPVESLSPFIAFSPDPVKTKQPLGKILLEEKWEMKTQFDVKGSKLAASIAAFTTNDLIVADLETHKISVFTPKGSFKYYFDTPASQPVGKLYCPYDISVTKDDRVVVINQPSKEASTATVKVFQAHNAKKIRHLLNITPLHVSKAHEDYDISCIGADENHIAVGNTAKKEITLYQTDGSLISTIPAAMIDRRLEISNQGRLIFSNYDHSKLVSLDMEGNEIFCVDTVLNGVKVKPAGMCCDRFGEIYIVLHAGQEGEIHHYSAEGAHIRRIAQHLVNPLGLTIMPNGDLAVADMLSVKIYHKV
ncbi:E3 ubiquitin-protein ligase TRIM56-like [Asterias rubens]|uniref:E3 ubiquitin-protein ligase TRIM56-like n=1 Tax=Asterias rubens TaxID=7604 RepID=UPI00145536F1|nr:E3 ubiquitin-protein ligase TRIM56-like [Asterias rubens]